MEFCSFIIPQLRNMQRTAHYLSNTLVELDGDRAFVESYAVTYHRLMLAETLTDMIVGGRFIDRFERRDGHWKIAHRIFVMDWNRVGPSTGVWDQAPLSTFHRGALAPDDWVYRAGQSFGHARALHPSGVSHE